MINLLSVYPGFNLFIINLSPGRKKQILYPSIINIVPLPGRRNQAAVQASGTRTVHTPSRSLFQPPATCIFPEPTSICTCNFWGQPWTKD